MKKTTLFFPVLCAVLGASAVWGGGGDPKLIPGIGPTGPIKKWHTGFRWAEGPIADGKGNVYFSDLATNKIYKIGAADKVSVFSAALKGPNGLMFNVKGELVACDMGAGRIVAFDIETKKYRVVADTYRGKGFGGPNDLVTDLHGGVYFTDYRLVKSKQDKMGVYYASADGTVTRLIDDLRMPNGVILSTDEKTLYVVPSGQPEVMSYPVETPARLAPARCFVKCSPGRTRNARRSATASPSTRRATCTSPWTRAFRFTTPREITWARLRSPSPRPTSISGGPTSAP
jgi:gluconolactonase